MAATPKEPISDYEFARLWDLYLQRKNPTRRSPERVDRPVDIQPSVAGARIVSWREYLDLVGSGQAKYPPTHWRASN